MTRSYAWKSIWLACEAVALVLCLIAGPASTLASAAETAALSVKSEPAALTVDELLDHMESVRKTIKTFKADVVKVREVEAMGETERFTGNIQFKTPRLLRLQLKSETNGAETIYIVGKDFAWIYRPVEKQAERVRLADVDEKKNSANPLEYGLARDIHGLREGYVLRVLPMEKVAEYETAPLELTPEGGTTYTSGRIIFWIDLKTWLPVQVREFKSNDEIVETYTFSNINTTAPISDKVFEFTPPKGVDVLLHDAESARRPR